MASARNRNTVAARLVLYTGKGGVGKTTTAASTAACAAARGVRTLVVSADAAHSLGDVYEVRLGPDPIELAPNLDALEIDGREEMGRHWGTIRDYLVALFRYQGIEEVVAEELALLPGAEEITTLLAVEEHARSGRYDLVVVDCAPTDTTLRLVTLPDVARGTLRMLLKAQQAISAVITPLARAVVPVPLPDSAVFQDAEDLLYKKLKQLRTRISADSTSVRLVVTPERMVIDEARRAFTDLCLFDVPCDAVVLNRMLPEQAANEEFFKDWSRLQEERRREVEEMFEPLRVLTAPLQQDEVTGVEALAAHGDALFTNCEPQSTLSPPPRLRFTRDAGRYCATLPLPGATKSTLEVLKVEDELVIRAGDRRRSLVLPRRMAALDVESAKLRGGELTVSFAATLGG